MADLLRGWPDCAQRAPASVNPIPARKPSARSKYGAAAVKQRAPKEDRVPALVRPRPPRPLQLFRDIIRRTEQQLDAADTGAAAARGDRHAAAPTAGVVAAAPLPPHASRASPPRPDAASNARTADHAIRATASGPAVSAPASASVPAGFRPRRKLFAETHDGPHPHTTARIVARLAGCRHWRRPLAQRLLPRYLPLFEEHAAAYFFRLVPSLQPGVQRASADSSSGGPLSGEPGPPVGPWPQTVLPSSQGGRRAGTAALSEAAGFEVMVVAVCCSLLPKLPGFGPRALALMVAGLGRMRIRHDPTLAAWEACSAPHLHDMRPHQLVACVEGLAALRYAPGPHWRSAALAATAAALPGMSVAEVGVLLQGFAAMGVQPPPNMLHAACQRLQVGLEAAAAAAAEAQLGHAAAAAAAPRVKWAALVEFAAVSTAYQQQEQPPKPRPAAARDRQQQRAGAQAASPPGAAVAVRGRDFARAVAALGALHHEPSRKWHAWLLHSTSAILSAEQEAQGLGPGLVRASLLSSGAQQASSPPDRDGLHGQHRPAPPPPLRGWRPASPAQERPQQQQELAQAGDKRAEPGHLQQHQAGARGAPAGAIVLQGDRAEPRGGADPSVSQQQQQQRPYLEVEALADLVRGVSQLRTAEQEEDTQALRREWLDAVCDAALHAMATRLQRAGPAAAATAAAAAAAAILRQGDVSRSERAAAAALAATAAGTAAAAAGLVPSATCMLSALLTTAPAYTPPLRLRAAALDLSLQLLPYAKADDLLTWLRTLAAWRSGVPASPPLPPAWASAIAIRTRGLLQVCSRSQLYALPGAVLAAGGRLPATWVAAYARALNGRLPELAARYRGAGVAAAKGTAQEQSGSVALAASHVAAAAGRSGRRLAVDAAAPRAWEEGADDWGNQEGEEDEEWEEAEGNEAEGKEGKREECEEEDARLASGPAQGVAGRQERRRAELAAATSALEALATAAPDLSCAAELDRGAMQALAFALHQQLLSESRRSVGGQQQEEQPAAAEAAQAALMRFLEASGLDPAALAQDLG